ncbi:MAG TPA: NAD-dependent protein deacetylase [Polyangia bacterium]|nr:NAD-dependent protein deacetylase [Polyangia bacterium]
MTATIASETEAAPEDLLAPLLPLLTGRRIVALTGAGCSTESGIPDYRGSGRTGPRNPIQHDAFLRRDDVRRRYWARATVGWARFRTAEPNAAHRALAALEADGLLAGVITQNVDRLHHRAGSRRVVELHGALAEVICLRCGHGEARDELQGRLLQANPRWLQIAADALPDGDSDLPADLVASFNVVGCGPCGGELKPDVVFFGGNVSEATLTAAWELFDRGEVLLVVGSSLTVLSGFRFVRRARELGLPVAIINIGPTRGDDLVQAKVSASAAELLPLLADHLRRFSVRPG